MRKFLTRSAVVLAALGLANIVSVTETEAASCARGARSQNSNTPVTVTFVNKSGEFRAVMWADFKGKLVPYAKFAITAKSTGKGGD
jgi:hypothetical protein